ncbi:hypothetical protein B0T17DRAFT_538788 [Bombardia bombarda]|uniref:Uncharacterized protein n=1 Tax=Bombardia bombarda TaxID=252184 RepID=A0AA40BVW5_9PEZI|nr:hypothetical protein B0T17DRAFT_538788 [Bombardia bombarda]
MVTAFPLKHIHIGELKTLCHVLWDWNLCRDCQSTSSRAQQQCSDASCPWGQRGERLEPFFEFYRDLTGSYVPDFFGEEDQALRGHRDLFDIVLVLRRYGNELNLDECKRAHFSIRKIREDGKLNVALDDQSRAFQLASRVMTMTEFTCAQEGAVVDHGDGNELGRRRSASCVWQPDRRLEETISDAFPVCVHPSLQDSDAHAMAIKTSLTAVNLTRIAGLKIERTSNLRDHLKLDQPTGVVQVFHHTSILKEHLLSSKGYQDNPESSMKMACLPRLLALETLYTMQLLFPQEDKSRALLRNLVSKHKFDPDNLRFGTALYELPDEKDKALRFSSWGSRLMDLYDEMENPKPRRGLDLWLERRSKSRHVMMATIAGVIAAVILGILTLCVSILQAWIAWQQWKEQSPVGQRQN